jgi:glyoxylase-like metal-dependent hydrolase (beta-lactamase superfamily II)
MMTSIISEFEGPSFYIAQFKTSELTAFSYYIESAGKAALVDPTFDTKVYEGIIAKRNATLNTIFLTHYHSDLVTGHAQFKTGVVMGQHSKRLENKFELH